MSVAIDLFLAAGLLVLATQAVTGQSIVRSVVMFIVFGLVMALCWARLNAPDLALAEAAIGAGITGALLLVTLQRLARQSDSKFSEPPAQRTWVGIAIALMAAALVAAIGWVAMAIPPGDVTAGLLAREALEATGIGNPVTAVLLVFRGIDTLLEVVVLLLAFLGARALLDSEPPAMPVTVDASQPLVGALLALIVPITVLASVYLLRTGGYAPGGAFQGGAVLAAGAVLLILSGRLVPTMDNHWLLRIVLVGGIVIFSLVGLVMLLTGHAMLEVPGLWAVYLIEAALMLSIALPLALLFAGAPGLTRGGR